MKNALLIIAAFCCCATYACGQSLEQNITEAIHKSVPKTISVTYELAKTFNCTDFIDTMQVLLPINSRGKIQIADVHYPCLVPVEMTEALKAVYKKINKSSICQVKDTMLYIEVPIYNAYKFTQVGHQMLYRSAHYGVNPAQRNWQFTKTDSRYSKPYLSAPADPATRMGRVRMVTLNHYLAMFDPQTFETVKKLRGKADVEVYTTREFKEF